jgi:hypothetical protein
MSINYPAIGLSGSVIGASVAADYDRDHFPDDLMLQETAGRQNFQGRFILRHPYSGPTSCKAGARHREGLPRTFKAQARTLAEFTGWEMRAIRQRMRETGQEF